MLFQDEYAQVQLQLLTATVKLFLKRPSEAQEMVQQVVTGWLKSLQTISPIFSKTRGGSEGDWSRAGKRRGGLGIL